MVDLRGEIETVNSKSEEEEECVGEEGRVWDLGILWWFLDDLPIVFCFMGEIFLSRF